MAFKTLLNGVNEVLTYVDALDSDAGQLASLSDDSRQTFIDRAVQAINEALDDLYTLLREPMPLRGATVDITLATSDRDYALPEALVRIAWPLHDTTNGQYISEYPGGYQALIRSQTQPANETGQPFFAAIRDTDGELYLDTIPQAAENGKVYELRYLTDGALVLATDTFPCSDAVFRALVPAVGELYSRTRHNSMDAALFRASMARAARMLTRNPPRESWAPIRSMGLANQTNPFETP